ncbi:hypothetical protein AAGS61_09130 [Lysinibacillus sp. KU-BSD001]|uniref:hypothetical protein n=1 Tax=Lysinibacillus sp. KU-BSD001 TaxID=3141328 RepID=UPI0036E9BD7E
MKKWLIMIGCIVLTSGFYIWFTTSTNNPFNIVYFYKEKWGIHLPQPDELQEIVASPSSFNGDGEWFYILQYKETKLNVEDTGMVALTAENVEEASKKIAHFVTTTTSMVSTSEEVKNAFKAHPIEVKIGDYYFYKEKNDGYDYFIALLKKDEQQIYLLEWHQ